MMQSAINRNYGQLDAVTKKIIYAPKTLKIDNALIMNPPKELYLKLGWKEIVEKPPVVESGYHWVEKGWVDRGDVIEQTYEIVKDVVIKTYRAFSKMKCVALLMKLGKWEIVRDWIADNGLMDLYLAAMCFKENDEYFIKGKTELQELLGLKDWEMEKILRQCVLDE